MEILARVNREHGCAVLVSLHQVDVALRYCPRVVAMRNGCVVYDGPAAQLSPEFLKELYCCDPESVCSPALPVSEPQPLALPLAA
jgi:phosphonate transport system ATP-binding protein